MKKLYLFAILSITSLLSIAQNSKVKGWHLLDFEKEGYLGTGVNRAYAELLKGRKSRPVLIAVLDSGIDTLQEDLRPNIWVNKKEINGNGIDDDKNGYKDDIYGWNFCGNAAGENLGVNTYEIARVYHGWKKEFEGKAEKDIKPAQKFLYTQWKRSEKLINNQYKQYSETFPKIDEAEYYYTLTANLIKRRLVLTDFKYNNIEKVSATADSLGWAVTIWKEMFGRSQDSLNVTASEILKEFTDYKLQLIKYRNIKDSLPIDYRGKMTKDNYTDINDKFYGNNNLKQHSGNHGTAVSGTIAAIRNNNMGTDGIMDNVKIMAVRIVPGGDEHDKDVALAIRYAVDNGAQIINMSFGKPASPYKQLVDNAIKYAAKKGVLLVHGSGNDGQNLDEEPFYPSPYFLDGTKATNLLTVGASSDKSLGSTIASFSNYSSKEVDVFAPGVYISTTASNNTYEDPDGTSLATPVAAGVAGLLKSYFPKLTPPQIISIIKRSSRKITEPVNKPGSDEKTTLSKLCSSGGIINAYEAIKLAIKEVK